MSAGETSAEAKRALYWLGDQLIEHRHPVSVVVLLITGLFAYWTFQLKLETSFSELLPQSHPFVQTHNKYAATFGGANNITVMYQVREGTIFTPEHLSRIFRMTEGLDRVYGINHNQIDSIGHRTTRYIKVAAAGTMRSEPVMLGPVKSEAEAADLRRIVHNSQNIYGILVSLDDRSALIRGNYVEGRLDHRRTFEEVNQLVRDPFEDGWFGALLELPRADLAPEPGVEVLDVYKGTAAEAAGLRRGDKIMSVAGQPVANWWEPGSLLKDLPVGQRVPLTVQRAGNTETLTLTKPEKNADVFIAGEPRLYGWVYSYTSDVFLILLATYVIEWILRWLYFHDWRGSLRPTLTGLIAAFWGFGFIHLIGLALDPLMLVIPFIITARAVSHAIQMHDRYYEEYHKQGWDKRKAIVGAFAELFVPTLSGIITDALGVLVILLVPVIMLQKLAITASWWILAITVSEMFLNPIVYYYLRAPDPEVVLLRERGWFKSFMDRATDLTLSVPGRVVILVVWTSVAVGSALTLRGLIVGDPTAASPLVWLDSPYNVSHSRIQEAFGGVEPLIVVNEGYDKDAMKDPNVLKSMQGLQRYLERDPEVGYSFSLVDILTAVNAVFHELEPKWGVIPNSWVDVGGLFFIFFSSSPPTETAKYVDAAYTTSHVTFFCRNHKGDTIRRIIFRTEEYIGQRYLKELGLEIELDEGKGTARISKVMPGSPAAKGGFEPGDRLVRIGRQPIETLKDLYDGLRTEANRHSTLEFEVSRNGRNEPIDVEAPWKAAYRLAGGLIGVLAAGNEALVTNDVLMNVLAFLTIYVILLFTYRSWAAGLYLLAPLFASNGFVNAYMSVQEIGINIHTLPVVTVGVGFGIDYGLYIVSRVIEEVRVKKDLYEAVKEALLTSGKAVTFTAITMIFSTTLWVTSNIRFDAEMGLLLAMWMGISYVASQTLLPVLILVIPPRFITREIPQ
jgi:hypothetical protein